MKFEWIDTIEDKTIVLGYLTIAEGVYTWEYSDIRHEYPHFNEVSFRLPGLPFDQKTTSDIALPHVIKTK